MRKLLTVLLFFLSYNAFSQSPFKAMRDTAAFKQKVDKMAEQTRSIQSDFLQTKKLEALSEEITSKGNFFFQKPNSLRWQYNTPYKYVIVINKEKMLIKDEDNKVKKYDINSNKVFREINEIMVSCVNGKVLSSGKFATRYFENEKGYKVELTPLDKNVKQSLKQINMYFDREVKYVVRLDMLENGKDLTLLEFSNQKLNEPVPAERFTLK